MRSKGVDPRVDLDSVPNDLSVRELAERTGVTAHTLRYYESAELLEPPARNGGGHRRYSSDDERAVVFVTRMRATGLGIAALREYMALHRLGSRGDAARRRMLVAHRAEIERQIEERRTFLATINMKIRMIDDQNDCK